MGSTLLPVAKQPKTITLTHIHIGVIMVVARSDRQLKIIAAMVNAVCETVEESHPEPAPKTSIYMAFQMRGIDMRVMSVS